MCAPTLPISVDIKMSVDYCNSAMMSHDSQPISMCIRQQPAMGTFDPYAPMSHASDLNNNHHQRAQSFGHVYDAATFAPCHGDLSAQHSAQPPAQPVQPNPTYVAPRPTLHTSSQHNIHLWQFLRELLDGRLPNNFNNGATAAADYSNVVRWLDRRLGTFKIENSHELARLWGARKNRCKMNYDKLSRSLRQYYKKGILRKTGQRQRLIYQFCAPYNLAE